MRPEQELLDRVGVGIAEVDQRQVNELPLNGRNPMNLVALAPSVVPQGGAMQNPNGTNPFAWGNYQIGGGFANQGAVYFDGVPANSALGNLTNMVPSPDAVSEFRVQTNSNSAEYGRYSGGIINFYSKSGTNEFHGTDYYFHRNAALDARNYFNPTPQPASALLLHQFGASAAGPIIPRPTEISSSPQSS